MMKRSSLVLAPEFISNWKTMSMSSPTFPTSGAAKSLPDVIVDPNNYSMLVPMPARLSDFKHHHHHLQNLTPKRSTLDSQSSLCAHGNNPKSRGATSASPDHDQTDDDEEEEEEEDVETDAGQCEQSMDPSDLKRLRRMRSNRESARRSRKRKQEYLEDLQLQAEQLRVEKESLCEQLTNAHHQFRDADTNNRVLKSDVEALRAKVTLAEDMIARGSLTFGLNQLLQSHLTSPQPISIHNLRRVANVSPTITVHGDDSSYSGLTVSGNSALGFANDDISNGNLNNWW